MGEKIVVGPINKGLRLDRTPFVIDNDSFPELINAYQWRGRIKRKRGTSSLGRLQRQLGTTDGGGNFTFTITEVPITSGTVSFSVGSAIFTDPGGANPIFLSTNGPGTLELDRNTGVINIVGSNANTSVIYYPSLPVMGLEDVVLQSTQYPGTLAFDTKYSYNISTNYPYPINDVSFYKNPAADAIALPSYAPKTTSTPLTWNGQDYKQFWTVNYQGALWATNGIDVPFIGTNIGMQFRKIEDFALLSGGPPADLLIKITDHGLVKGDFIFVNEANPQIRGLNFQTGYVVAVPTTDAVQVIFPKATVGGGPYTANSAIAQYLTNRSDPTKDCIRWYDGDPTTLNSTKGWVNFCPPLSQAFYSIADLPQKQYYLVSARMIVPFKDRLLFIGPVVQTSGGSKVYLQDTIIYSQNGTPYYTCSFSGDPLDVATVFNPILLPDNQTATPMAFWEDQTGFGGFLSAGIDQPMITASPNEDVLIIGFSSRQSRLIYTGNDIIPFNLFIINSELGSGSTFSAINMDHGVLTRGSRGYILTGQTVAQRIDLDIPDQVFEMRLSNNGSERVCAQRDFINEWVYFTYPSNEFGYNFPTQTLLFNYRDNSWGLFNESYTTYGLFRQQTGRTWLTIPYAWENWNESWISGDSTLFNPQVIAGNQQGFVLFREDETTEEGISLYIQNIVSLSVTCPNHCLNSGDFILISNALGSITSQTTPIICSIGQVIDANNFTINESPITGNYLGGGNIKRLYVPFIQTKQFPVSWGLSRKTRIGAQQYLLTKTDQSSIQLLIYLSQDDTLAYNNPADVNNNSLIYSTVLYTCPESTNLGLTAANSNLQMIVNPSTGKSSQNQIWHRKNTSLIGDTVQIGFTISDDQMKQIDVNGKPINATAELEIHGFILDVTPSQLLA